MNVCILSSSFFSLTAGPTGGRAFCGDPVQALVRLHFHPFFVLLFHHPGIEAIIGFASRKATSNADSCPDFTLSIAASRIMGTFRRITYKHLSVMLRTTDKCLYVQEPTFAGGALAQAKDMTANFDRLGTVC